MKNITLKTIPTVAVDYVLILPTKNVSTRLYILVSSIEMMVGIAIAPITRWTGAWVRNVYLSLTALFYNLSYPAEEFFQGIVATVRTVPR